MAGVEVVLGFVIVAFLIMAQGLHQIEEGFVGVYF
jgi:erlin